jgi:cyclopropane fatty-acyl-phospholipid synthase-like methyltransferase
MLSILANILARQFRRPRLILGRMVARKMEKINSQTYTWMLSNMSTSQAKNILEIGYGTEKMLDAIARSNPNARFTGIDFSKTMRKLAQKTNDEHIRAGRMRLLCGDVLTLSASEKYDLVFGINVIYFWEDLKVYLEKIRELLSDQGKLYLYISDPECMITNPIVRTKVFYKRKTQEVTNELGLCGFGNIKIVTGETSAKIAHCIGAEKPIIQ